MSVVRFLERKPVVRFFGSALILSPFLNFFVHALFLKNQLGVTWDEFQIASVIRSAENVSFVLAFFSIAVGAIMLSGVRQAWAYTLILIGAHLGVQILNINHQAWKDPLAWPTFLLNIGLFVFILDQLVWKADRLESPLEKNITKPENKKIVHLKSYRKILFSFGSHKPWGELKTLSSEILAVKKIAEEPAHLENKVVQIFFSDDVIVDIVFHKSDTDTVYFKLLNMNSYQVKKLNLWLRKIAV